MHLFSIKLLNRRSTIYIVAGLMLASNLSAQFTGAISDLVTGNVSNFNIIMSGLDNTQYMSDPRADQQTGQYADDLVGNATNNPGFMMNIVSYDTGITGIGVQDYLVMRVRTNEYSSGGFQSNSRMRFGIDADADNDVDLFFGFDGTQNGLPTLAFQDSGTGANISPSTSTIGGLFTPVFETTGDTFYSNYIAAGGSAAALGGHITTLMTLINGTTYDYRQTTAANTDVPGTYSDFAGKKANTPDPDSYVTFAIPFFLLAEAIEEASALDTTGGTQVLAENFTLSSSIRLIAYTATQNNAINQDLFGANGIDTAVTFSSSGGFSAVSNIYGVVPEFSTFVQVGVFAFVGGLLSLRRRRYRFERPA